MSFLLRCEGTLRRVNKVQMTRATRVVKNSKVDQSRESSSKRISIENCNNFPVSDMRKRKTKRRQKSFCPIMTAVFPLSLTSSWPQLQKSVEAFFFTFYLARIAFSRDRLKVWPTFSFSFSSHISFFCSLKMFI